MGDDAGRRRVEVCDAAQRMLNTLRRAIAEDLISVSSGLTEGAPGRGVLARGDYLVFFSREDDKLVIERVTAAR